MNRPRIFKYTVPVDDQVHRIHLQGPILNRAVASQVHGEVQFWAMFYGDDVAPYPVDFQVVGTGQPFPDGMLYVGTAFDGPFVWHLLQREVR